MLDDEKHKMNGMFKKLAHYFVFLFVGAISDTLTHSNIRQLFLTHSIPTLMAFTGVTNKHYTAICTN